MSTANFQHHLFGTLWEIEVDYSWYPAEPDTGVPESIDVEALWLLGYYPEGNGKIGDYVSCRIKADTNCFTQSEEYDLHDYIKEAMAEQAREAFDYDHSYED